MIFSAGGEGDPIRFLQHWLEMKTSQMKLGSFTQKIAAMSGDFWIFGTIHL